MSALSRNKGNVGEREVAALIREHTGLDCRRRVRQHDGDSDLLGVPGWSIEVKRYGRIDRADIRRWWAQAVEQARESGDLPVLFYRRDRDEWRVVYPISLHLLDPSGRETWDSYIFTVEASVEAWAAVLRETICSDSKAG